jgi:hypothetical protein
VVSVTIGPSKDKARLHLFEQIKGVAPINAKLIANVGDFNGSVLV